ncbi:MAG: class I SAM-dependent methyltransferase [Verrucomicrobiota bacterium]
MEHSNKVIEEIFRSEKVTDESGTEYPLHSSVTPEEGAFIEQLIGDHANINKSIEIGCAYGLSSLFICHALRDRPDSHHIIVDPFQASQWHGIGLKNLQLAGFDRFECIEERSEFCLPRLVESGLRIDFAFIDGWHTFDHTLLDFFYINRLLNIGGVVIIDDTDMPPVDKVVKYVKNYPCYRLAGRADTRNIPTRTSRRLLWKLVRSMPPDRAQRLFSPELVAEASDGQRSISTMTAFQKIAEDDRSWSWFANF